MKNQFIICLFAELRSSHFSRVILNRVSIGKNNFLNFWFINNVLSLSPFIIPSRNDGASLLHPILFFLLHFYFFLFLPIFHYGKYVRKRSEVMEHSEKNAMFNFWQSREEKWNLIGAQYICFCRQWMNGIWLKQVRNT